MQPVDSVVKAFVDFFTVSFEVEAEEAALRSFQWDTLRRALNDVRADARTRRIAKGMFRTNPGAAIGYAEYYPARVHSERPVIKSYDREV